MGDPFLEAEKRYQQLLQNYQQALLDAAEFAEQLAGLRVQDEQQRWWQLQGNGAWLCFHEESGQWESAIPQRAAPPPPPPSLLLPPVRMASAEVLKLGEILWPEEAEQAPLVVAVAPLLRIPARPGRPPQSLCPACQAPMPTEARFCGLCGHSLIPSQCPECHQAIVAGARFCKFCGHSLNPEVGTRPAND